MIPGGSFSQRLFLEKLKSGIYKVLSPVLFSDNFLLGNPNTNHKTPQVNLVNTLTLAAIVGACSTGISSAQNDFFFQLRSNALYNQNPGAVTFGGGDFQVLTRDGLLTFQGGCIAPEYFPPSPPPCPIGATGFIWEGSIDAGGAYLSVLDIKAARILRPYRSDRARLVAAPPSLLPRPIAGFQDEGYSVFWNIMTPQIQNYDVSIYSFNRVYSPAERNRFDGELVTGTYRYNFQAIASEIIPVVIDVNLFPGMDGFRKFNNQLRGFRFINVRWDDDGFMILDPFVINTVKWEGNTTSFVSPTNDQLFLSIKGLSDPADPTSDPIESIFPNFVAPGDDRVLVRSPLATEYLLPPFFLTPGQSGLMRVDHQRFRPTNNLVFDRSVTLHTIPVRVANPFGSFVRAMLPAEAEEDDFAPDADFDGDGVSNFTEWVFGSDPADPNSVPNMPKLKRTASDTSSDDLAAKSAISEDKVEFSVQMLKFPEPPLLYEIQHSADLGNWETITGDNADWKLVTDQDTNELKAVARDGSQVGTGGFFRVKVTAQ